MGGGASPPPQPKRKSSLSFGKTTGPGNRRFPQKTIGWGQFEPPREGRKFGNRVPKIADSFWKMGSKAAPNPGAILTKWCQVACIRAKDLPSCALQPAWLSFARLLHSFCSALLSFAQLLLSFCSAHSEIQQIQESSKTLCSGDPVRAGLSLGRQNNAVW
jgi:hypothetical protein